MGMSPRLLRPRASSALVASDSDAKAYINAVRTADGGQYMEAAVQRAIDNFVKGCKSDGIWSAIKASCILMGARTLSGALTPLVGAAPTNNGPFVSGDYNRETGLIGNASSKYLDTNRNNNADPQNSQHMSVYVSQARTNGTHYIGFSSTDIISAAVGSAIRSRGVFDAAVDGSQTGLLAFSRSSSTAWQYRIGGTTTTGLTTASSSPASGNVFVYARNFSGAAGFVNPRMVFYSIGESLDLALLDSRVTTLYNAIGAAI